jgi:hypothetical protein
MRFLIAAALAIGLAACSSDPKSSFSSPWTVRDGIMALKRKEG